MTTRVLSSLVILSLFVLSSCEPFGFHAKLKRIEIPSTQQNRNQILQRRLLQSNNVFDTPLKWNQVDANGTIMYVVEYSIGNPAIPANALLDLGSNLVWTQCDYPHGKIEEQALPLYNPWKSNTFKTLPCSDPRCTASTIYKGCIDNTCKYYIEYEGNFTVVEGLLATETFHFGSLTTPNLLFGCSVGAEGKLAGTSGILGIGRGPHSLMTQLGIERFSFCASPSTAGPKGGHFFVGEASILNGNSGVVQSTPLIDDGGHYYIELIGISFNGELLPVQSSAYKVENKAKNGAFLIDNGMAVTLIPPEAYDILMGAIVDIMSKNNMPYTAPMTYNDGDFYLCFLIERDFSLPKMPDLVFHFAGGANITYPRDSYMYRFPAFDFAGSYEYRLFKDPIKLCFSMVADTDLRYPFVLGNYQLQDLHVQIDVKNKMVHFVPEKCSNL